MDTLHLVDPELRDALAMLPDVTLRVEDLPALRAASATLSRPPIPDGLEEREVFVARQGAGDVRVLVTRPTGQTTPAPAVLWIHGGGYVMGSADEDRGNAATFARALDAVVVSVDYGLAPENPHPGPVEECYEALRWLHENADDLGVDRSRVAVGGTSAGAGLAAALALLARDRAQFPLAFQYLGCPMLDDRTVTAEPNPATGQFVWTRKSNEVGWRALLGTEPGSTGISPYAAAARAEDLSGLPATFLEVGSIDLFFDEDVEYARRLVRDGVPTELHVYPGAFHGYRMAPGAAVSRLSAELGISALRRGLHQAPGSAAPA